MPPSDQDDFDERHLDQVVHALMPGPAGPPPLPGTPLPLPEGCRFSSLRRYSKLPRLVCRPTPRGRRTFAAELAARVAVLPNPLDRALRPAVPLERRREALLYLLALERIRGAPTESPAVAALRDLGGSATLREVEARATSVNRQHRTTTLEQLGAAVEHGTVTRPPKGTRTGLWCIIDETARRRHDAQNRPVRALTRILGREPDRPVEVPRATPAVQALRELGDVAPLVAIAERAGVDRRTASRQLKRAADAGFVIAPPDGKRGQPYRIA